MKFRALYKREFETAKEIYQYSFHDPEPFADWYFRRKIAWIAGAFEGEQLCAMGALIPKDFDLRGKRATGCLLAGVTTRPEYRGIGIMKQLMPFTYRFMAKKGACIASLYPFSYGFYRHFGWETGTDVVKVRVSLNDIPTWKIPGHISLVEDESGLQTLCRVYARFMEGRSGYVWRDEGAFLTRLEEHEQDEGYAAVYTQDGEPQGYLLYHMEGKIISCDELAACTPNARKAFLTYLSRHASTMEEAAMALPADDPVWRMLPDARGIATLEPYCMYRVLDVVKAAEGVEAGTGAFALRIHDEWIPENDGVFAFSAEEGKLVCQRSRQEPVAQLDVRAFTQWLLGYRTAFRLADEGTELSEEAVKAMDRLLPPVNTFMYEMY